MQLKNTNSKSFNTAIFDFVIASIIVYVAHLVFALYSSVDSGIKSILSKSLFFYVMSLVAPFLVIAKAPWHVIPAIIVFLGVTILTLKKLCGWKRIISLIAILLGWQLYGLFCLTYYIGA